MSARHVPHLTPEQYLEIERASDVKHEYFDGQMFAMAGGTYAHFRLIGNFEFELNLRLRGGPCNAGSSDLRVRTSDAGLCTYPDIVVICGKPEMSGEQKDTLLNPTLIAEVLSESTEAQDRGFKFHQYRHIESLKEYVLVSQFAPLVEVFARCGEHEWRLREYAGLDAVCRLESVACEIAMADIYRGAPLE